MADEQPDEQPDADLTREPPPLDDSFPGIPPKLARHPAIKALLRELATLRHANVRLAVAQRAMMFQALEAARNLEPLNPAKPGAIIPAPGFPTILHVDNLRLRVNRVTERRDPTIRILVGGRDTQDIRHAREVRLRGTSLLSEHYIDPLPNRKSALVTLSTWDPIEIIR